MNHADKMKERSRLANGRMIEQVPVDSIIAEIEEAADVGKREIVHTSWNKDEVYRLAQKLHASPYGYHCEISETKFYGFSINYSLRVSFK